MLDNLLNIVIHNLLVRELFIVFLIVMVIVAYVHRYVNASKADYSRTRARRMTKTVGQTRTRLIVLVILLVAVLGYDRVYPMLTHQTTQTHQVAKASSSKHTVKKVAATKKKKTSTSSSSATSSSSSTTVDDGPLTKKKAAQIVANYYAQNPGESADASETYKCTQRGNGSANIAVYIVTGYKKDASNQLVQTHTYWVYPNQKFAVQQ